MNNKLRTTLLGGLLSASIASPVIAGDFSTPIQVDTPAVESDDMFSFGAGYHSDYIFRGANIGSDLVDWSLEASTTVGCYDLTAGVWAARFNSGGEEIDFYASVAKDFGFATVELGYIFYYFDNATGFNTQEAYLGLSKEIAGIDFSATYYHDFDFIEEDYFELGASKTINLGTEIDASLVLGFNVDDTELSHVQPTISKTFDLNSEVSITPYLSYSFAIEDFDYAGNALDDEFIAGVSIGFSF